MIVTEEEAKTKRCQESFGDTIVTNNGHSFASSSPSPFQHGYSYPGGAQAFAVQTSPSMCIGSACMAWRDGGYFVYGPDGTFRNHAEGDSPPEGSLLGGPDKNPFTYKRVGYCGKAGKP
jgi:hypothetical protein